MTENNTFLLKLQTYTIEQYKKVGLYCNSFYIVVCDSIPNIAKEKNKCETIWQEGLEWKRAVKYGDKHTMRMRAGWGKEEERTAASWLMSLLMKG